MVTSVSPETEHTPAKAMTVSRESPAAPVSDRSLLWRVPEGTASVPVGGGGARLLCPWATRPGRASRRRTEPHISDQAPPVWRAPEGTGGLRHRPLRAAGSRVAISRAGRRPPAHTAARPIKVSHAAAGTPAAPRATQQQAPHQRAGAYKKPTSGSDVGLWWS